VLAAGGGGMIMANDAPSAASLNDDPHVLPATHISYADGIVLKAWMAANTNPVGTIAGGVVDYDAVYGDNMASFSSRGPAGSAVPGLANLIKPDVTAPGLNILAAYFDGFTPSPSFNIISGTSMSSPHAAGAAALIRALHPGWTPPEVKSALMMTGIAAVDKEDGVTPGDPFDFGAGRIDLTVAGDVGFVLHITEAEYIAANPAIGGDPRLLNLPSMADADCAGSCSWTRTLRSVLGEYQEYNAWIAGSGGIVGTVTPSNFTIPAGGTQVIIIELDTSTAAEAGWNFAHLHIESVMLATASAGNDLPPVNMPIAAFIFPNPIIEVVPDNLESTQLVDTVATQTLTINNLGAGSLDWEIFEDPGALNLVSFWEIDTVNPYANSDSAVYYDDTSLVAVVDECDVAGDIPWISVTPTNGSTPGGGSSDVTVTFDAAGLAEGVYEGLLCVSSNDATAPITIVPLTLNVLDAYELFLPFVIRNN
jgi:hypothetical protein